MHICYTATHCNTLQHTATHCNTHKQTATFLASGCVSWLVRSTTALICALALHTMESAVTLQHTATHTNKPHHYLALSRLKHRGRLRNGATPHGIRYCDAQGLRYLTRYFDLHPRVFKSATGRLEGHETFANTYIHIYIYIHTYICMYIYIYTEKYMYVYRCVCVCVYVCVCVCFCVCICVYVCV